MVGTACESFRRHFSWKVFVINLLYRTLKEKLKSQGHHPFKLGFSFTKTCIMIVSENVMKSARDEGQNIDF